MPRCKIVEEKVNSEFQLAVWHIEEAEQELEQMCRDIDLNSAALQQIETYKSASRRTEIYATYLLLYSLMPQTGLIINHNEDGKPLFNDCNISISHTKNYVAIIISKSKQVGIDIEYISNRVNRVVEYFLRQDEFASDLTDKLIQWCAKETAFKFFSMRSLQLLDFKSDYNTIEKPIKKFHIENTSSGEKICITALICPEYVLTYTCG